MQERIKKLIVYSPTEIEGVTDQGNIAAIQASWPCSISEKYFERFLERVFIVITPLSNGGYQLRASMRCLGGGNDNSTPKRGTTVRTPPRIPTQPQQPNQTTQPPQVFRYSNANLKQALDRQDHIAAMNYINAITPADKITTEDLNLIGRFTTYISGSMVITPKEGYTWAEEGFRTMIQKSGFNCNEFNYSDVPNDAISLELLQYLIDHGFRVDDVKRVDILNRAIGKRQNSDFIKLLIKHGANLNCHGSFSQSAFTRACYCYHLSSNDNTYAIYEPKYRQIALALAEAGAYAIDYDIEKVCMHNWIDVLKLLVKQGYVWGRVVFDYAIKYSRIDMIPILVAHGVDLKNYNFKGGNLETTKPQIYNMLLSLCEEDPEFTKMVQALSIKMIRLLQGDLYKKLEAANKISELESILASQLSTLKFLINMFYHEIPELEMTTRRQNLIDSITKKLNEILGSSFYFDSETGTLRSKEVQDELKEVVGTWAAMDSQADLRQKSAASVKQQELELLNKQVELEQKRLEQEKQLVQQRLEQEKQIAQTQAQQAHEHEQERKKELHQIQNTLDKLSY